MAKAKKKEDIDGIFVAAGLMIGLGLGFLIGNLVAWTIIGLGAGLLTMALMKKISQKKK